MQRPHAPTDTFVRNMKYVAYAHQWALLWTSLWKMIISGFSAGLVKVWHLDERELESVGKSIHRLYSLRIFSDLWSLQHRRSVSFESRKECTEVWYGLRRYLLLFNMHRLQKILSEIQMSTSTPNSKVPCRKHVLMIIWEAAISTLALRFLPAAERKADRRWSTQPSKAILNVL